MFIVMAKAPYDSFTMAQPTRKQAEELIEQLEINDKINNQVGHWVYSIKEVKDNG